MKVEYRLSALDDFACLGSDCPASCCDVGWDIHIEPDIHRRWAAVENETERARLLGSVREVERNGKKVLLMSADENRRCRLLTADGLCSAQVQHGEDYLPGTCRIYPRYTNASATCEVSTAVLSCPEIARRVLFAPTGSDVFRKSAPTHPTTLQGDAFIQHALTELLDKVMAETKFPTATRLYYLADFLVRIAQLSERGQLNLALLADAPGNCRKELYDINLRIKEKRLRPDPVLAGAFWHALFHLGRKRGLMPEPPEPRSALLVTELADDAHRHYAAIYSEISRYRGIAQPVLRGSHDRPLSNYLYAALLKGGFAWQPFANNYIATFMRALIPFALTSLRLWLIAGRGEALTDNTLIESVYLSERALGHNNLLYTQFDASPELLRIDRYHNCLTEL